MQNVKNQRKGQLIMKSNLDLVAKYNPVLLVANSILDRSFKDGQTMTHMKLQKLTYFVYKKYLEDTGNTLFDEDFEAWKYGPALRSVYEVFRAFAHIDGYYAIFDGEKNPKIVSLKHENFYDALDFVMKRY